MPLSADEAALERDIVTIVNRTDRVLTFVFDSIHRQLAPRGQKGDRLLVPRYVATEYAIPQQKVRMDLATGRTTESLVGIDGDDRYPTDPLEGVDLDALKSQPKHELTPQLVKDPDSDRTKYATPEAVKVPGVTRENYAILNE